MQYLKANAPRIYPGVMMDTARPWEDVLHLGRRMRFRKGAVLSLSAADRLKMVYVKEGTIAVSYFGQNGESHINLLYKGGSFFNENVAITGVCHQEQPAICLQEAECCLFDISLLSDRQFREEHENLIHNLLLCVATKVVNFHALLNVVCTKKAIPLVAWYIMTMYDANDHRTSFAPGITQREIASLIGVDISSMTRAIRFMKKEGIISGFTKRDLNILDVARLKALSEQ